MPINFPFLKKTGLNMTNETPATKKSFVENLNLMDLTPNLCIDEFKFCKAVYAEMNVERLCAKMPKGKFARMVLSSPLDKKPYIAILAYLMDSKGKNPRMFKNLDIESVALDIAVRLEKLRNDIAMSEDGNAGFLRWYSCENDALFAAIAPAEDNTLFFEFIFTFGEKTTNLLFECFTDAQTKCARDYLAGG